MSDYLTRLAARALGIADVARPRASVFEPRRGAREPPASLEAEWPPPARAPEQPPMVSEPAVRDGEETTPLPSSPVPSRKRERKPPPRAAEETLEPKAAAKPARTKPPPAAPSARPRAQPASPAPIAIESVRAASNEAPMPATSGHGPVAPEPDAGAPTPARRVTPARAASPHVLAARLPRLTVRQRSESPPTVRVTIGRVDVRAVVPEQPHEPAPKPRQAPRMSLDDYLSRDRSDRR